MDAVLILAGGFGGRFGSMKQFCAIHGIPLLIYTLKIFSSYPKILTIPEKYCAFAINIINHYRISNIYIIAGGKTRQESVYNGLKAIKKIGKCNKVLITDACRPCITKKTVSTMFNILDKEKAVVAASKSINTICYSDGNYLHSILDRTKCYDLLMPQAFDFKTIYTAHKNTSKINATDDSQLLSNTPIQILPITLWEGLKLTYPEDYKIFELLLKEKN